MQATRSDSTISPSSAISAPQGDLCLCARTTKIAVAIFGSLTGFILLPFSMAITLSAIVIVGALCCCGENNTPQATLDPELAKLQARAKQLGEQRKKLFA